MPPSSPQSGAIRHRWGNGCRLSHPATTVDAGHAGGLSPRGFGWGVARSRTWAGLWALGQLPRRGTMRHPREGLCGQAPRSGALPQWVPMPGHTAHPGGSTSSSAQGTKPGTPRPCQPQPALWGALCLAVPLKPLAPSALLNSLAAGKRQQGRSEAPNAITVPSLSSSLPRASSQPHLSRRRRAGREEGNQGLSRAETVLLQP